MIRVIIGDADRQFSSFKSVEEGWVARQLKRQETNGRSPCVRVQINHAGLNVVLRSGTCEPTGGGGPEPNRRESRTFELWQKKGLNEEKVEPGHLISFLKQVRKLT